MTNIQLFLLAFVMSLRLVSHGFEDTRIDKNLIDGHPLLNHISSEYLEPKDSSFANDFNTRKPRNLTISFGMAGFIGNQFLVFDQNINSKTTGGSILTPGYAAFLGFTYKKRISIELGFRGYTSSNKVFEFMGDTVLYKNKAEIKNNSEVFFNVNYKSNWPIKGLFYGLGFVYGMRSLSATTTPFVRGKIPIDPYIGIIYNSSKERYYAVSAVLGKEFEIGKRLFVDIRLFYNHHLGYIGLSESKRPKLIYNDLNTQKPQWWHQSIMLGVGVRVPILK